MSDYTTFQLGGSCRWLVTCRTPEQLANAVRKLEERPTDYVLIGGGSNVLVSDEGYDGVVLRYCSETPIIRGEGLEVTVSGSTMLDDLVVYTLDHELDGLVKCSGIPGTVGGAIVGNAGAFGEQIGDCLVSVTLLNREGDAHTVPKEELGLGYRCSLLQESGDIVVDARLALMKGERRSMEPRRADILKLRSKKHPDVRRKPCIGSIFRNVEATSSAERRQAAGWFLEQAGAKELRVGGARVYEHHGNIIVKGVGCTAEDVHELAGKMALSVQKKFDLRLVREFRYLGRFKGEEVATLSNFY